MSRETDERVAVKVFGWQRYAERPGSNWVRPDGSYATAIGLPPYSSDPRYDYEVLRHVRETWGMGEKVKFGHALQDLLLSRTSVWPIALMYEPGDYARAALKALGHE